jgi:hypothetical protein
MHHDVKIRMWRENYDATTISLNVEKILLPNSRKSIQGYFTH